MKLRSTALPSARHPGNAVESVACSKQVYIELMEATVLFYLTNAKDSERLYTYVDNRLPPGTLRHHTEYDSHSRIYKPGPNNNPNTIVMLQARPITCLASAFKLNAALVEEVTGALAVTVTVVPATEPFACCWTRG